VSKIKKVSGNAIKNNAYTKPARNTRAYTVVSPGQKKKQPEKAYKYINPKLIIILVLSALLIGILTVYFSLHVDTSERTVVLTNGASFHNAVYSKNAICDKNDWIEIRLNSNYERMYKVNTTEQKVMSYFNVNKLYSNGSPRIFLGTSTYGNHYLVKTGGFWYIQGDRSLYSIEQLKELLPGVSDPI